MRYLPVLLLLAMSVMGVDIAQAQEASPPTAAPTHSQSRDLVTHPASVNQPGKAPKPKGQPLSASQLNAIAGSISVKPPSKPKEPAWIPNNVIPEDLLPKWEPKPVTPLDDFKVSPLDEGFQVPIK